MFSNLKQALTSVNCNFLYFNLVYSVKKRITSYHISVTCLIRILERNELQQNFMISEIVRTKEVESVCTMLFLGLSLSCPLSLLERVRISNVLFNGNM